MSDFVKAETTSTPSEKSQGDIIAMLHRYGASGFGFRRYGDVVECRFYLPKGGEEQHTVAIPIDISAVHARLNSPRRQEARSNKRQGKLVPKEQAERVAWRILHLWIDAALAAVSIGAQSLEEAFFAHLVVANTDGQEGRVIDYIHMLQQGAGGQLPAARLLLGSGDK